YGFGIHQYSIGGGCHRNTIRNSTIHHTGTGMWAACILIGSGSGNVAYNNICYSNSYGIEIGNNATDGQILNNTIYGSTEPSLYCIHVQYTSGTIVKNNICYGNAANVIQNNDLSKTTISNNLVSSSNPGFVDAALGDFHLKLGSPAIDAG